MIREMLDYQTRDIADPELRLKHAFALVNFLAASNPRTPALREELQRHTVARPVGCISRRPGRRE